MSHLKAGVHGLSSCHVITLLNQVAWGSAPGIVALPEGWESERGIVALLAVWGRGPGTVDLQVRGQSFVITLSPYMYCNLLFPFKVGWGKEHGTVDLPVAWANGLPPKRSSTKIRVSS